MRIRHLLPSLALILGLVLGSALAFAPRGANSAAPAVQQVGPVRNGALVESAARTATGTGATSCGYGGFSKFAVSLVVSAASGTTPTLDVTWQHSIDGGTTWFTVVAFTQRTAAANELKVESEVEAATAEVWGDCMRAVWTIGGTTPSFTFKVDLQAQA